MNFIIAVAAVGALVFLAVALSICFRVVVSTNDVHIVQSGRQTISFGKDQPAGNTYYAWPPWVPIIGIKVIKLPVSVFDLKLDEYAAYDKGRVPFVIDIMAFFRIEDSNMAAQRVHSLSELTDQLKGILQGACRSILAKSEIEEILEERSKFGQMFTDATNEQLKNWGVGNVKNIELMDVRDAQGSKVIDNIMAKKKSLIEMQSRMEVAKNIQAAQQAEIDAQRAVQVRNQEALEQIGVRTAQKDQQIGITGQLAEQAIQDEVKNTTTKKMAVLEVEQVRHAEIMRGVEVVEADKQRQAAIILADGEKQRVVIAADGQKQQTVILAEGNLQQAKLHAQGVEAEGNARGAAETAVLLAPVTAQTTLAKEIGSNEGYQKYLLGAKEIEKNQVVGVAQAEALKAANIKVIANSGDVSSGVSNVMDLLTAKGGTQLGAMAEAFSQTEVGSAIVGKLTERLLPKVNGAAKPQ